ncbi:MAG: Gliding motility-associated C-terminal protein [Ferruginibacter sp.]|nr:Gliding motility-associated C-terminal protein [Ferruginibacter sp.]
MDYTYLLPCHGSVNTNIITGICSNFKSPSTPIRIFAKMNASFFKAKLFLFGIGLALWGSLHGQICVNKFSSIRFTGATYDTFTCSAVTKTNEIISTGNLYDYNGAAHIAKYSAKGSVIWSYQYNLAYFSFYPQIFFKTVHFTKIMPTADDGFLVAGNVDQVLSPFGNPPPVKIYALLAKIDKFGKVLWNKTISNFGGDMSFSNIFETSGGDYIAYMTNDNGKKKLPGEHTYGRVLRINPSGTVKWSTLLFTYLFDAGGLGLNHKQAITQAQNKNIIIGDAIHKTDPANGSVIKEGNLHFMELDYATGKVNWETSYEYPVPLTDIYFTPDIVSVSELAGGQFSFITSLYLPAAPVGGLSKKGVNIITSNKGVIQNMVAYAPADGIPCNITDIAISSSGSRTLLFNKKGKAMLVNINADGQVIWNQGYDDEGGRYPANCFSAGKNGFNIFMSSNKSTEARLLITDPGGVIDCMNLPADILAQPATLNYSHDSVVTNPDINFDNYLDYAYPLKRSDDYPLSKNVDCQQTLACCTDFIDSSVKNNIRICEGKNYVLPDSTIIKDSGTYYITYKTPLGCDSIVFYKIGMDKDVSDLRLGPDTCLTQTSSIKLQATPGYDKYFWGNNLTPTNDVYTIDRPGNFWVTVSNSCGLKTDSISIYAQCDFPVYMPKAFTPNYDNLNDYFRVPSSNKNRLIRFTIFNRWGHLIFQTTNPQRGWDGTWRNEPLPSDTYVYYLEMEGFSGKRILEKGSFILVR